MSAQLPSPPTSEQDVPVLKRSRAVLDVTSPSNSESSTEPQRPAGKSPMGAAHALAYMDAIDDVPDLAAYFAEFPEIDFSSQVRICRAYASFLVAQLPKKPRKKRSKAVSV